MALLRGKDIHSCTVALLHREQRRGYHPYVQLPNDDNSWFLVIPNLEFESWLDRSHNAIHEQTGPFSQSEIRASVRFRTIAQIETRSSNTEALGEGGGCSPRLRIQMLTPVNAAKSVAVVDTQGETKWCHKTRPMGRSTQPRKVKNTLRSADPGM